MTTEVTRQKPYQLEAPALSKEFDVLVDIRSKEAYEKGHLLGAINVPPDEFADWIKTVPDDVTVYLYSKNGRKADDLVERFKKSYKPQLRSLIGGFVQWELCHKAYITNK